MTDNVDADDRRRAERRQQVADELSEPATEGRLIGRVVDFLQSSRVIWSALTLASGALLGMYTRVGAIEADVTEIKKYGSPTVQAMAARSAEQETDRKVTAAEIRSRLTAVEQTTKDMNTKLDKLLEQRQRRDSR